MKIPAPKGSLARDFAEAHVRLRQLVREIGRSLIEWSRR